MSSPAIACSSDEVITCEQSQQEKPHLLSILGALIGVFLEAFDVFIYTHLLLVFLPLFLPNDDPYAVAMTRAMAISVGFLIRPAAGLFFGWIGDRWGRRTCMVLSIWITGIATFAIGLMPTFEQIGTLAPLLFVVCRMIQVFAISGETTTSALFVLEHAAKKHVAFYTGLINVVGSCAGIVAAFVSLLVINYLPHWGWRVPFIVAGFFSLGGFLLRRHARETLIFENIKHIKHISLIEGLRISWLTVWRVLFVGVLTLSTSFIYNIQLCDLYKQIGLSNHSIMMRNIVVLGFSAIVTMAASIIADRWSPLWIMRIGVGGIALGAWPILRYMGSIHYFADAYQVFVAQLYFSFFWSLMAGTYLCLTFPLFSLSVRLQIGGFVWGVSSMISAGGMPLLAVVSVHAFSLSQIQLMGIYLSIIGFVVLWLWRDYSPANSST